MTIKLDSKSEQYIKDAFSKYTKVDKLPEVLKERTLIHLYSTDDTWDEDELNGYIDALFFNMKIYMTDTMSYYEIEHRDGVNIRVSSEIRIFKDGSTMIILDDEIEIQLFQCVEVVRY